MYVFACLADGEQLSLLQSLFQFVTKVICWSGWHWENEISVSFWAADYNRVLFSGAVVCIQFGCSSRILHATF